MLYLYMLPTCPYCLKVIDFLDENYFKYETFDINNQLNLEKLMRLGGKKQVPFLVDTENNVQMYESDDIIHYLETLKTF